MKNLTKFFAIAVVILGFSATSFGQNSANATSTAKLVAALSISGGNVLNFGYIIPGGGGSVTLPGVVSAVRSSTLVLPGGTVTAAAFTITGTTGSDYTVTLPSNGTVTVAHSDTPTDVMEVNNFSCDVTTPGTSATGITANGTLASGTRTFYVGATLTVGASDPIGTYTSATFPVTVVYQ